MYESLLVELSSKPCRDSVTTIVKITTVDTPFAPVDRIQGQELLNSRDSCDCHNLEGATVDSHEPFATTALPVRGFRELDIL